MLVDTRDILGSSLATRRLWEPHVTPLFRRLLSEGDVFADVGAHIGFYTLIASEIVGPAGCVDALEPRSTTRELLEMNVKRNEASNVRLLAVAAGAERASGVLRMPSGGDAAMLSLATTGRAEEDPTTILPLTDVIDSGDVARLSLVKIDVEGYDDRILQGVEPLLSSGAALPAILLEVHARLNPAVREPVADFCRRNGMAPHLIGDDEGFDRRFALSRTEPRLVTPDWIVTTHLDHFELLLMPAEDAP